MPLGLTRGWNPVRQGERLFADKDTCHLWDLRRFPFMWITEWSYMKGNAVASPLASHVEKHRLVVALQADVEAVDAARSAPGDQGAAAVGRHQRQHRVGGIGRFILEIDPGVVLQQHAAGEHRHQDMRRLRLAVGIRHRTGLDGVEAKLALGPGAAAAKPLEGSVGSARWSCGSAKRPWASACQISSMQSGTKTPSPS